MAINILYARHERNLGLMTWLSRTSEISLGTGMTDIITLQGNDSWFILRENNVGLGEQMEEYTSILYEKRDNGIVLLTLNREKAMNSFNSALVNETIDACNRFNSDPQAKVLVCTGKGKGFSAGGDIGELASIDSVAKAKETFDLASRVVKSIYDIKKPVIMMLNGPVAGAAGAAVLSGDIIIASHEARFAMNFVNIAFCPDSGVSFFLTRKLGHQKAAEILYLGKILNANEALELGLYNKVVPREDLEKETFDIAEALARGPSKTIEMIKFLLRQSPANDLDTQAQLESMCQIIAWASEDFKEGASAFLEKRPPRFRGK